MNISRIVLLITTGLFFLSKNIHAEEVEQDGKWFAGVGYHEGYFIEDDSVFAFSSEGVETENGFNFHIGKEFFGNSKLMLGYRSFQNADSKFFICNSFDGQCVDRDFSTSLSSIYLNFRPHWEISENFLLYAELGIHDYIRKGSFSNITFTDMTRSIRVEEETFIGDNNDSAIGLSWGFGLVFRLGEHDLSLGFETFSLGKLDEGNYGAVSAISLQYDYHFDL
jgi:opacity protein-like surface antigen